MGDVLLLGLGAPFYTDSEGNSFIESQTVSGLEGWSENFEKVIAYAICHRRNPPPGYVRCSGKLDPGRIELVEIPDTFGLASYQRNSALSRSRLADALRRSDRRVFTFNGWIGDPGMIAASVARKLSLPYAIWFDRVESQVSRHVARRNGRVAGRALARSALMQWNENRAVAKADLTLLHGQTVFEHFSGRARNARIVENIHIHERDRIGRSAVEDKSRSVRDGPIRIVYCGRATAMKGADLWIETLASLKAAGVPFEATWVGDGDMLPAMKEAASRHGLGREELTFTGFVDDPAQVRDHYRRAHLLLYCHMTDESPRNLIESLHSATPLVGFGDPYSRKLVGEKGAGRLVARGDVRSLSDVIVELNGNRDDLADMIRRAADSAAHLTRRQVFKARSDLVREYLS